MIYKKEYTTNDERVQILEQNTNLQLIEEQNISSGNFLIFTDASQQPTIEQRVSELEQAIAAVIGGAV